MRLWSLHPGQLDARGLVAVWREGLLARAVLAGVTTGYRHHPQLDRFRSTRRPVTWLDAYLGAILDEADRRGYAFDRSKIEPARVRGRLAVTSGQLDFEWAHLAAKLRLRDPERYRRMRAARRPLAHPLFTVVGGGIEPWERV